MSDKPIFLASIVPVAAQGGAYLALEAIPCECISLMVRAADGEFVFTITANGSICFGKGATDRRNLSLGDLFDATKEYSIIDYGVLEQ